MTRERAGTTLVWGQIGDRMDVAKHDGWSLTVRLDDDHADRWQAAGHRLRGLPGPRLDVRVTNVPTREQARAMIVKLTRALTGGLA